MSRDMRFPTKWLCPTSKASDQPAHMRSLIRAFASLLNILWLLLSVQHLGFLSLKGGCTGLSEATLVKMSHCWKSHVAAHMTLLKLCYNKLCYKGIALYTVLFIQFMLLFG